MLVSTYFINMITHKKYILASSSFSRKTILKNCGFNFVQVRPSCDEEVIKKQIKKKSKPEDVARILSYQKAKSISEKKKYFNYNVIGCDTLIKLGDKIFDKAKNNKEALLKLKKLSGKKHKIISSLTICNQGSKIWECSETTVVEIRKLTTKQIEGYLKKSGKQILQSVGCYQLEALGPQIIKDIKGDFFNVMGLPLFKLLKYVFNEQ